jgi:hypothetical protein
VLRLSVGPFLFFSSFDLNRNTFLVRVGLIIN